METKKTILVIDDNPVFRLLTRGALQSENYRILEASDGTQGLEVADREHPDLIITDVLMPEMDGYEFLRQLRMDPKQAATNVIFYTGTFSGMNEEALAKAGGVLAVLIKPAPAEEMRKIAAEALLATPQARQSLDRGYQEEHLRILTNQLASKVSELEGRNEDLNREVERRKEAEDEALQAKVYFEVLLDSIPQLAWKAGQDGFIEYGNLRWHQFHGLKERGVSLERWSQLVHPDDRAGLVALMREAFARRIPFQCESRLLGADGGAVYHWISSIAVKDASTGRYNWFCTGTDLSTQKKYEQSLVQLREQAEVLSRAKTEFLNNVSHELRTPLTSILGFSEALLEEKTPQSGPYLERIHGNARRLTGIIEDMISISELEVDGMRRPPVETFGILVFMSDLESEMGDMVRAKGLKVRFESGTENPSVRSYPEVLMRILKGLVGNAVKFTDRGGVTVRSWIETPGAASGPRSLVFEVEDTGIGIEPAVRDQLFRPFSQADGSSTRRHGGMGLGLLLARKLALLAGGRLEIVRSVPGEGSCFRLSVPVESDR